MMFENVWGDNFFDEFFTALPSLSSRDYLMNPIKTDIVENDSEISVLAELPGFEAKDIEAEFKEGYLTVRAEKKEEKQSGEGKFVRKERIEGAMSRKYYIGKDINEDEIKAKFENGILKLSIPKKNPEEIENKRRICIEG